MQLQSASTYSDATHMNLKLETYTKLYHQCSDTLAQLIPSCGEVYILYLLGLGIGSRLESIRSLEVEIEM
jgi:hypothetical protein